MEFSPRIFLRCFWRLMKGFLILVAMPSEQIFSTKKKLPFSEKATNFCEISTVHLSYILTVKYRVEILQNFVAFSEYMNFTVFISSISIFSVIPKLDNWIRSTTYVFHSTIFRSFISIKSYQGLNIEKDSSFFATCVVWFASKVHIFWEGQKILQNIHRTNNWWRFLKILHPSQNIWTLPIGRFCRFWILYNPIACNKLAWKTAKKVVCSFWESFERATARLDYSHFLCFWPSFISFSRAARSTFFCIKF